MTQTTRERLKAVAWISAFLAILFNTFDPDSGPWFWVRTAVSLVFLLAFVPLVIQFFVDRRNNGL